MGSPNENRALPGVTVINCLLGGIALIVVSLRIYTRAWVKPPLGWDDILIVLALVFGVTYTVGQLIQVYDGHYGHHKWYLSPSDWILIWKWNAVVNTILPVSVFCSRASICLFLLRLLKTIRRWRYLIFFALGLNTCVCIGTVIMYAIECVPVSREWNTDETKGFCVNREAFDIIVKFFSSLNCVVDFLCAGIPFAAMRTVRLDQRTRLGLYLILCCGVVTAACSIGRAVSLDFKNPDPTFALVPLSYWTAAEMYGAIIFASLPALRQLLSLIHGKASAAAWSLRWPRRRRSHEPRPSSEPTVWTYSPDSGGFGSFMGSGGRTRQSFHGTSQVTSATGVEAARPANLAEVLEEEPERRENSAQKPSTPETRADSFFKMGSLELGETSGQTTQGPASESSGGENRL